MSGEVLKKALGHGVLNALPDFVKTLLKEGDAYLCSSVSCSISPIL